MALLTSQQIRQIVRQPAVWTNYLSFDATIAADVNAIAMALHVLPTKRYANDTLKISTHDQKGPFPAAAAYDENVVADVPDTPYLPATTFGEGVQQFDLALITSGLELQLNLKRDLVGDDTTPDGFESGSVKNAMRASIEDYVFNGTGGIEPIGFLNANFPKQSIATGADLLASIDEAIMAVNCGGGVSQCDVIFCNRLAARKIASLIRTANSLPTPMTIPTVTGRSLRVMAHNSPQGLVPIVVTDFIATSQGDTTLIMTTLNPDTGVHLAVPDASPEIRITKHRLDRRPSDFYIAEFKFGLATLDTGKTVALTGFTV